MRELLSIFPGWNMKDSIKKKIEYRNQTRESEKRIAKQTRKKKSNTEIRAFYTLGAPCGN